MRRAAGAMLWAALVAGCVEDKALIETLSKLEDELAQKRQIAQNLTERRHEMDALEQRLEEAVSALSDGGVMPSEVDQVVVPPSPPPIVVAPVGVFESGSDQQRRRRIADTQRRIAELDRVLGEVVNIDRRRAEVEARLKKLEAIRSGR